MLRNTHPTIAEGVETQQQLDYLIRQGVDYFQGYLFSRPLDMETFIQTYCVETASASTTPANPWNERERLPL